LRSIGARQSAGDAQLGEGALGAHRAARGIDAPDVRRDAAGERRADESLAGVGQAQLAQRLRELGGHLDGVDVEGMGVCAISRTSLRPVRQQAWPDSIAVRHQPWPRSLSISRTSAYSAWFAGVATPSAAPRRATKPLR
jgi:hypothetical protein